MLKRKPVSAQLLSQIAAAIEQIRFGFVQITIHDSQVVQIEKAEKIRLDRNADLTEGGSDRATPRSDQAAGGSRTIERGQP